MLMKGLLFCVCLVLAGVVFGQNRAPNGDFEAEPLGWTGEGASLDRVVFHGGKGALRLETLPGKTAANARPAETIALNQKTAEPLMAAVWLRAEVKRPMPGFRAGMTIRLEFADGGAVYWYWPFELATEELSGAWVYREGVYVPRSPVAAAIIGIYWKGAEGVIWADDIYFGPPTKLPAPPVTSIPIAVTGEKGRCAEWATFQVKSFRPAAHVFHLKEENLANIAIQCEYDVTKPAPMYLNSAWGSQYWTLYHLGRRELCQIYTDERLDLSKAGPNQAAVPMNKLCDDANPLRKGGYVFITDYLKNFLLYASDKPSCAQYDDAKTGQRFSYWDAVKLDKLKSAVGPSGTAAPFSVANLASYRLGASARRRAANEALVTPFLEDADRERVPLLGLDMQAKEMLDADGLPTGQYLVQHSGDKPLDVTADVRLMLPAGLKTEALRASVPVEKVEAAKPTAAAKVHIHGWDGGGYALSDEPSDGPASMKRLVADAKKAGLSSLITHAKSSQDCAFPSKVVPSSQHTKWDHLAAAVEAGNAYGVRIYAGHILGVRHEDDLMLHPDWVMPDAAGKPTEWYCYMNPDVRSYHIAIMKEVAANYAIDGIALDYDRPGPGCYCTRCQKGFEAKYGKPLKGIGAYDPDWLAWKRDAITDYMRQISAAVRPVRPGLKLGGYVWSRLVPDKDRAHGQDFPTWLKEGTFDFVFMGNYF
ncbi:MAG: hypothetical protein FJ278_05820, partial [Planctomycetes bacterium]|nr:hypothetical protein [Planctomycetota bacterium]